MLCWHLIPYACTTEFGENNLTDKPPQDYVRLMVATIPLSECKQDTNSCEVKKIHTNHGKFSFTYFYPDDFEYMEMKRYPGMAKYIGENNIVILCCEFEKQCYIVDSYPMDRSQEKYTKTFHERYSDAFESALGMDDEDVYMLEFNIMSANTISDLYVQLKNKIEKFDNLMWLVMDPDAEIGTQPDVFFTTYDVDRKIMELEVQ